MESNIPDPGNAGEDTRDLELLTELQSQGVNIDMLKFYRWLYERGLLEPPARFQPASPMALSTAATPKAV